MLAMYGWDKEKIGVTEPLAYQCPYCAEANTTTLSVYSKYYHILSVPVLPFEKESSAECTQCKASRKEIQLGADLLPKAHAVQKAVRHPFRMYRLTILLLSLLLIGFLTLMA